MGAPMPSGQTILVIDDEAGVRDFFTRALELSGFGAVGTPTAEGALRLLADGLVPDAMILDLLMPGMGGLGFMRELELDRRYRTIPIAIVTGHIAISEEVRDTATGLGIGIHHKPVTLEELLDLTRGLLQRPAG
jgi:DNA-binding response OmpR family regulator